MIVSRSRAYSSPRHRHHGGSHLPLLIPGIPGVVIGLLLVAIGSGGLKSNASVLVGSLYSDNDSRRDAGFTIFTSA